MKIPRHRNYNRTYLSYGMLFNPKDFEASSPKYKLAYGKCMCNILKRKNNKTQFLVHCTDSVAYISYIKE